MLVVYDVHDVALITRLFEHQFGRDATVHKTTVSIDRRAECAQQICKTACKAPFNVGNRDIVTTVRHTLCHTQ